MVSRIRHSRYPDVTSRSRGFGSCGMVNANDRETPCKSSCSAFKGIASFLSQNRRPCIVIHPAISFSYQAIVSLPSKYCAIERRYGWGHHGAKCAKDRHPTDTETLIPDAVRPLDAGLLKGPPTRPPVPVQMKWFPKSKRIFMKRRQGNRPPTVKRYSCVTIVTFTVAGSTTFSFPMMNLVSPKKPKKSGKSACRLVCRSGGKVHWR